MSDSLVGEGKGSTKATIIAGLRMIRHTGTGTWDSGRQRWGIFGQWGQPSPAMPRV